MANPTSGEYQIERGAPEQAPFFATVGESKVVGAETVTVRGANSAGLITECEGLTVPTDATSGYAKDCVFVKTDAATGVDGKYVNVGTTTSCKFILGGQVNSTSVNLGTGKVMYGVAGIASEKTLSAAIGDDVNMSQGTATIRLYFSGATGTFAAANTITGVTSAKTATVASVGPDYLVVTSPSGEFTAGETINAAPSGASATVVGTLTDNFDISASFPAGNRPVAASTNTAQALLLTTASAVLASNSGRFRSGDRTFETKHSDGFTSVTLEGVGGVTLTFA